MGIVAGRLTQATRLFFWGWRGCAPNRRSSGRDIHNMAEPEVGGDNSNGDDSRATPASTLAQDPGQAQGTSGVATESTPPITAEPCAQQKKRTSARKDKGRLHAVRHGALARYPLEALRHLGEDVKALRRLERRFRAELKPRKLIAELAFDRFWAAYLRCLLAARVEASAFFTAGQGPDKAAARVPALLQAERPTLVTDDEQDINMARQALAPDVLQQLVLVQRYDRHYSREMFQALALLIMMREGGEHGFEQSITKMFGVIKEST